MWSWWGPGSSGALALTSWRGAGFLSVWLIAGRFRVERRGLGRGTCCARDKRPGPDLSLAVAGLAVYDEIEELFGEEAGIRRKGALVVHADSGGWALEQARLSGLQAAGVSCSLMSADEVREAEPSLSGSLLGASWFPDDLQCAPRAISIALARAASGLGAVVETGREVLSIVLNGSDEGESEPPVPPDREGVPHVRRHIGDFRAGPPRVRGCCHCRRPPLCCRCRPCLRPLERRARSDGGPSPSGRAAQGAAGAAGAPARLPSSQGDRRELHGGRRERGRRASGEHGDGDHARRPRARGLEPGAAGLRPVRRPRGHEPPPYRCRSARTRHRRPDDRQRMGRPAPLAARRPARHRSHQRPPRASSLPRATRAPAWRTGRSPGG